MESVDTPERASTSRTIVAGLALTVGFIVLSWVGRSNYLLFHAMVESFGLVVMAGIFVIAWSTRDISSNRYLLILGVTHLFVAIVVGLHTFAYRGMGVFPGGGADLPTQLWVISRGLESLGFLVAGFSLRRDVSVVPTFVVFGGLTALALGSVWPLQVFPVMYVDGVGLTAAKIVAEYAVMAMFAGAFVLLWHYRKQFEPRVGRMLLAAIALMIAAELAFTLYVDVYGVMNFIGHYIVFVSFLLIYRALILTVLREPYSLLFRELKRREEVEHRVAEALQSAILSGPDRIAGIEVDPAFTSATEGSRVGGDFWDVFSPTPGLVAFVLGDICGKGIEAVAANVTVRVALRSFAYRDPDPSTVLHRTNDVIGQQFASDKFATVVYGVVVVETGEAVVASAGHPAPILLSGDVVTELDVPINPPLGVVEDHVFEAETFTFGTDWALVLFSDGLVEAGQRTGMFGIQRIVDYLAGEERQRIGLAGGLLEASLAHAGRKVDDDVTVLALRFSK
ncbi:MAG: MASE3 domain-containing protein [Coriobacteriia bacterium]|nr:MASE3 domain-containing protein [Coriobacteriia bacterium]